MGSTHKPSSLMPSPPSRSRPVGAPELGVKSDGDHRSWQDAVTSQRMAQNTRRLVLFRLLLGLFALAVIFILPIEREASIAGQAVFVIVLIALLSNAPYLLLPGRERWAATLFLSLVVLDLILVTLLVFYTGGVRSPFTFFFFGPVLAASLSLSVRQSLLTASLAVILLSLVYGLGYMYRPHANETVRELRQTIASHLSQGLAFFLVCLLSSRLSMRLGERRVLNEEILESIGQGLLVLGAHGRIEYANHELTSLLGLGPAELIGARPEEAFAEPRFAALKLALADSESMDMDMEMEMDLLTTAGDTVPLRLATVSVPRSRSSSRKPMAPVGRIAVFTDLTLQKKADEAVKQAERSEAVSSLATAIAHEIRNPLASIHGAVQEVRDSDSLREEHVALMNIVLSESDRLDGIIADFLQFARMRPIHKVACNLREVIAESVTMLEARREAKGVVFALDAPDELPCRADPDQLRQVLLNLGLNSLDALTERDERRVSVTARPSGYFEFTRESRRTIRSGDENREGVSIEFADTGCGMDERTRLCAFDPFFTRREGGTGLGLAVVARVIKGHDGIIDLQSTPDVGTSIRIWLPAA